MKRRVLPLFVLLLQLSAFSQLKISAVEKLSLAATSEWSNPTFSPDGKRIYYSTSSFQGIWEYTLASKSARQVVADPQSGYNFSISPDGKKIAYRRTQNDAKGGRLQEIVSKYLIDGKTEILGTGNNLSTPTFAGSQVVYTDNITTKNLQSLSITSQPMVIGIEDTKISVVINGEKKLLDPLRNGSYIWPALSPNGKRIVANEMARGTFICDLKGNSLVRLGRRNAAVWTRDSKWLVYMNDKDDGHSIVSSDLYSISADGKHAKQLTSTGKTIELNPQCSPVENKIVCNTLAGEILLLTYEEVK
jgi:Tol biopolymer transport system component